MSVWFSGLLAVLSQCFMALVKGDDEKFYFKTGQLADQNGDPMPFEEVPGLRHELMAMVADTRAHFEVPLLDELQRKQGCYEENFAKLGDLIGRLNTKIADLEDEKNRLRDLSEAYGMRLNNQSQLIQELECIEDGLVLTSHRMYQRNDEQAADLKNLCKVLQVARGDSGREQAESARLSAELEVTQHQLRMLEDYLPETIGEMHDRHKLVAIMRSACVQLEKLGVNDKCAAHLRICSISSDVLAKLGG